MFILLFILCNQMNGNPLYNRILSKQKTLRFLLSLALFILTSSYPFNLFILARKPDSKALKNLLARIFSSAFILQLVCIYRLRRHASLSAFRQSNIYNPTLAIFCSNKQMGGGAMQEHKTVLASCWTVSTTKCCDAYFENSA